MSGVNGNNVLSGFFLGMTKEFYMNYRKPNGDLYPYKHTNDGGDGKWGGQEGMQIEWGDQGAELWVIGKCWIAHAKERGWVKTKHAD
jgi:hypothetical protein